MRVRRPSLLLAAVVTAAPATLGAQTSPPVSDVPQVIQAIRARSLEPPFNALLYRSEEKFSATRSVPRGGPIWHIPKAERALDFNYTYEGKTYTPVQFMDRTFTNAMLVIKDGRIVFETYRNMARDHDRFIGFSMTKSITSILIGCALAEGRIRSLDDPIERYLPELKGGAYEGVSVRQLLRMRSGIQYKETYDPSDKAAWVPGLPSGSMVDNIARYADAARTVKRVRKPGTQFDYKNLDTAVLGWLLERVSGGSSIAAYTSQRLWEPLGAEQDGFYLMDGPPGAGREFNIAGYNASLRDWGRVGLMMLNGGRANGRQIVSPEWVAESTKQLGTDQSGGWGYGYQWWTVDGTDAYAARGLAGQTVYIQPSTRTVIVKLSYFPPSANGGQSALQRESDAFFQAASAWTPR